MLSADGQKLVGNTEVRIAVRPGVDTKYSFDKLLGGQTTVLFPPAEVNKNLSSYTALFKTLFTQ